MQCEEEMDTFPNDPCPSSFIKENCPGSPLGWPSLVTFFNSISQMFPLVASVTGLEFYLKKKKSLYVIKVNISSGLKSFKKKVINRTLLGIFYDNVLQSFDCLVTKHQINL